MKNLTLGTVFILLLILSAAFENRVSAQVTYTWNGLVDTNYQNSANWTPARATPAANDILVFNGMSTPAPTVTNIPTQTVGQIQFINNVSTTFGNGANPAGASTLTVGGGNLAGSDFTIAAGSALTINAGAIGSNNNSIRIAGQPGSTGNIAGTLTLTGSENNGFTLNATGSGLIISVNNGTINNAGTFQNSSNGSTPPAGAVTNIFFNGTSVYNHTYSTMPGTIPLASWASSTQTNVIGYISASGTLGGLGGQIFGNFTWNSPSQAGGISFGGASLGVQDTFRITSTGTNSIRLGASTGGVVNTVNFSQTGGTLDLSTGAASGTLRTGGTFNKTGGTITETGSGTENLVEFNGAFGTQSVTVSGAISNRVNYRVSNNAGIILTGTLNVNADAFLRNSSAASPAIVGGAVTYTVNTILIYDAGTFGSAGGSQTAGAVEFPAAGGPPNLTINNTTAAPNNVVSIPLDRTIPGTITLTEGVVTNGANILTSDTAGTVARTNGFVEGNFRKLFAAGGGQSFEFPVGTVSGPDDGYTPVNLTNLTATAGSGLTVKAFDTGSPEITTAKITRYWELTEAGSITTNLQFTYLFADQSPIPAAQLDDLRVFRNNINECQVMLNCVTPATTTSNGVGTVTGKTVFSPWGIGVDATTADAVDIGGRVRQANGRGVFRARVTLIDAEGVQRVAYTNPFGYYRFTEVLVGETYVITASHLRYQIAQPTQVHFVEAENVNINFTAFIADDAEKPLAPQKRTGKQEVEPKRP